MKTYLDRAKQIIKGKRQQRKNKFLTGDLRTYSLNATLVDKLKSITDARILNLVTGKQILMRSEIPEETSLLLKKISPH